MPIDLGTDMEKDAAQGVSHIKLPTRPEPAPSKRPSAKLIGVPPANGWQLLSIKPAALCRMPLGRSASLDFMLL